MKMQQQLDMILIMGITGSGKSYFINKLASETVVEESAHLASCTATCALIPAVIGSRDVILVDTPGFDDTVRSDSDILSTITSALIGQYKLGFRLRGVVWIHKISEDRFQGSAMKTLRIFQKICGESAFKHVTLATSRWEKTDEALGGVHEYDLRQDFWRFMLDNGSKMERYYGDRETAIVIVSRLLDGPDVVLEIQREILQEHRALEQTSAGVLVSTKVEKALEEKQQERDYLEELRRTLTDRDVEYKRSIEDQWRKNKEALQVLKNDQALLHEDLGRKIDEKLELIKSKSKSSKWKKGGKVLLSLLPTAIGLLGMLAGIPTGFTGLDKLWDDESGIGSSISDFFDS